MVNAALHLRRPLLITGNPGVGKSTAAYKTARELSLGPVLRWPISSRTASREGLWDYDAIGRVQAAADEEGDDIGKFVRLGPLGTALLPYKRPRVLLIDELDKSDIHLPNDLLAIFEDGDFEIPPLARVAANQPEVTVFTHDRGTRAPVREGHVRCREFPIIVITSNGERDFPAAFLRRCLRLEMKPSNLDQLTTMAMAHFKTMPQRAADMITEFVTSSERNELDEEQTAVRAAESGIWLPVHRPAKEHPFELVLVVDRSWSMRIWDRTVAAFRALLARQGAFTDVKTYLVNTNEDTIRSMESIPGTTSSPRQLSDPTGRRIVLVVTDGVGRAWRTGSMHGWMSLWARTCQVALIHLLPPERWTWTGINVKPQLIGDKPTDTHLVPVLALNERYLHRWVELVSGTGKVRLPILQKPSEEDRPDLAFQNSLPADERLRRFRAIATPQALRLAGLLSGALILSPRTIRAIHRRLIP